MYTNLVYNSQIQDKAYVSFIKWVATWTGVDSDSRILVLNLKWQTDNTLTLDSFLWQERVLWQTPRKGERFHCGSQIQIQSIVVWNQGSIRLKQPITSYPQSGSRKGWMQVAAQVSFSTYTVQDPASEWCHSHGGMSSRPNKFKLTTSVTWDNMKDSVTLCWEKWARHKK